MYYLYTERLGGRFHFFKIKSINHQAKVLSYYSSYDQDEAEEGYEENSITCYVDQTRFEAKNVFNSLEELFKEVERRRYQWIKSQLEVFKSDQDYHLKLMKYAEAYHEQQLEEEQEVLTETLEVTQETTTAATQAFQHWNANAANNINVVPDVPN